MAYTGPLDLSPATLNALHLAHLYAVPFENLDIHLRRQLSLDQAALFDKVVTRRRGGFCYELNGLFCALLRELGFRVTMLSAEVARQSGGFSPAFDHLALLVDLDEPWLADVGFGNGFRLPLRLNEPAQAATGLRNTVSRSSRGRSPTSPNAATSIRRLPSPISHRDASAPWLGPKDASRSAACGSSRRRLPAAWRAI